MSARHQDFEALAKKALKAMQEDASEQKLDELAVGTEPIRELKRPTHGYLGLQNHDPGDVVWFKEVSVRPLGSAKGLTY